MEQQRYKPRVHQVHFDLDKDPSRTDQSHKDTCDINRILDKAKRTGVVSHINKHGQQYGDFTDFDYKDTCDINRILDKAKRTGVVSHINKHGQQYGDFTDFDYEDAQIQIAKANSIFYDLDAEIRKEFGNKPKAFFDFVNNPENKDALAERLPHLAQPGKQLPDVVGGTTEPKPKEYK